MSDRRLDSLSPEFRPVVFELLARLTEAAVPVMVVCTGRTPEEQTAALASGHSSVLKSKHLPRKLRGRGTGQARSDDASDAIDLCPYELYQLVGPDKLQWAPSASPEARAAFETICRVAEALGLRSGARWQKPHDPGHVEWLFPGERYKDIPIASAAWSVHGVR